MHFHNLIIDFKDEFNILISKNIKKKEAENSFSEIW